MLRALITCTMLAVIPGIVGCGGQEGAGRVKTVPFTGKLYVDGSPKGSVSLQFTPQSSEKGVRTAYALVKEDGTFESSTYVTGDGIIPGKYFVSLGSEDASGSTDPMQMMAAAAGAAIEQSEVDVPDAGLTDVEIKLTTRKDARRSNTPGAMLGQ